MDKVVKNRISRRLDTRRTGWTGYYTTHI